jgi:hypothetical protein
MFKGLLKMLFPPHSQQIGRQSPSGQFVKILRDYLQIAALPSVAPNDSLYRFSYKLL